MWASSKVAFTAPLKVGDTITRTSKVLSVTAKSGGSGDLVFVEVEHQTNNQDGVAVREVQSIVYRGAAPAGSAQVPPRTGPDLFDPTGWDAHRTLMPTEPLLFRFSALTFNSHRIHYDLPYSLEQEFYPGLVVQGPLTASLLIDLCSRHLGDQPLSSFRFRGMAPAFCGEALHLVGRQEGQDVTLSALGADGRTVMSATATIKEAP
jgi:3-methylfumaryl-CoA hydratase